MDCEPESKRKKRFRPQFRLVTLFWVTLVVASFFAGRSRQVQVNGKGAGAASLTLWQGASTPPKSIQVTVKP